jgi:hypothetical protein
LSDYIYFGKKVNFATNQATTMNKLLFFSGLILLLFNLVSCKEEIEFTAKYKDTPIIYGLLDPAESLHFVKIQRGFVGPGNALDFAQIPDSNYFEQVDAEVVEILNGQVARTWTLRDTLMNDKDTNGIFFGPQYKAYYFSTVGQDPLNSQATYRLKVDINKGKMIVTGETQMIQNFGASSISNQNTSLRFAKNPGEFLVQSLIFKRGNSAFANATFEILISEFRGTQKDTITIPWTIYEGASNSVDFSTSAQGATFYEVIKKGLTNDNTITKRNMEGIRVILTGGSQELYNYITISKPSSSLTQTKPNYTNLKVTGDNTVIGLFSTRSTVSFYKPFFTPSSNSKCIDKNSTRELCKGVLLSNDKFCSQHPIDNAEEFKCN